MKSFTAHSSATAAPGPAQWSALLAFAKSIGGEFEVQVHGHSMGDALPNGSDVKIVVLKDSAARGYADGEVALFWGPEGKRLVAHRVVKRGSNFRQENYVITRGDGCVLCDAPLNLDEVIGTVVQVRKAESWEPVPPPVHIPLPKRGLAGLGVFVAGCWAFCSTPALRRRLALAMWRLRGNSQLHE